MNRFWAGIAALSILCTVTPDLAAQTAAPAYGAYGHYPIGSTRVLAMGGAFVGLADDASAVVSNPAGLAFAKQIADYTIGEDRVVNREVYFNGNTSQKEGLPYTSQFNAGALRLGFLGLGASYARPYDLDYDAGGTLNTHRLLRVESFDVALALGFYNRLAVGVAGHMERVRLAYQNPDGSRLESKGKKTYPSGGLLFQATKNIGLGITFAPERRYDLDEKLDLQISGGGVEWFHDVVIPAKTTLGMSVQFSDYLSGVGDIDVFQPVKNAIFVGGSQNSPADKLIESQQTVVHGGFEYFVRKSKALDFIWRGGGYIEPARLNYTSDRFHFTMGVEVRYRFIVLAASYDQAAGFSNVAQSAGINIGAF